MGDGLKEVDFKELVWKCRGPEEVANLLIEALPYHDRILSLCQGQPENVMAFREFAARMLAWGYVRGARDGLRYMTPQEENSVVGRILKSATIVNLIQNTRRVSTLKICEVLDAKRIRLPWSDLRNKMQYWARCANKPVVKMAISHARQAAKLLAGRARWLSHIKSTDPEFWPRRKAKRVGKAERGWDSPLEILQVWKLRSPILEQAKIRMLLRRLGLTMGGQLKKQ
jgi:hypothetical protein